MSIGVPLVPDNSHGMLRPPRMEIVARHQRIVQHRTRAGRFAEVRTLGLHLEPILITPNIWFFIAEMQVISCY